MRDMQQRQAESNEQMRSFVEQLRQNVAQGQRESTDMTLQLMKELGDSTHQLVQRLQDQAHNADQQHAAQQAQREEQMEKRRTLFEQLLKVLQEKEKNDEKNTNNQSTE